MRAAFSENTAKFVPEPSQVAPSGYAVPGQMSVMTLLGQTQQTSRSIGVDGSIGIIGELFACPELIRLFQRAVYPPSTGTMAPVM